VEVFGRRVRRVLHGEFEVAAVFWGGGRGRRGYGEAACFGEGGDEGVEPLAWEELGLLDLRWKGRSGRRMTYFDGVVWVGG
jgi:hypothetical protein